MKQKQPKLTSYIDVGCYDQCCRSNAARESAAPHTLTCFTFNTNSLASRQKMILKYWPKAAGFNATLRFMEGRLIACRDCVEHWLLKWSLNPLNVIYLPNNSQRIEDLMVVFTQIISFCVNSLFDFGGETTRPGEQKVTNAEDVCCLHVQTARGGSFLHVITTISTKRLMPGCYGNKQGKHK